jgi:hypothetical protein
VDEIINRGFALVTVYREDIAADRIAESFGSGVHSLYPELQDRRDNFGTIAAWAWALSRVMDYIETDPDLDAKRTALFGWSRLGKAALWAAANDMRFGAVISNQSGAGGAKMFHRGVGENIRRLCTVFPHWYCRNFCKYMDKDTVLPFDQHLILSLIAPRPLYVGSAQDDSLADPEGEFESVLAADTVYRFLGAGGLTAKTLPGIHEPVRGGNLAYHLRAENHDVTAYDWQQYIQFLTDVFK